MKKYTPSVKNNNAVKEELCSEMKGLLYRIEKGKYDRRLDRDGVRDVYDTLPPFLCAGCQSEGVL